MPLPLDDVLEVSIEGIQANQRTLNIRHYRVAVQSATPDPLAEQQEFLDILSSVAPGGLALTYLNCCSFDYRIATMRVQRISPARFPFISKQLDELGRIGETSPGPLVAGVIDFGTGLVGRKQRGSIHVPGVTQTAANNGNLGIAQRALYNALGLQLRARIINPVSGGEYQPVIFHRVPIGAGTFDDITSHKVQPEVRVMRRRTVGVGI